MFNFKNLTKKSDSFPEIVDLDVKDVQGNNYLVTKDSYIVIKNKTGYINFLKLNYKSSNPFSWGIITNNGTVEKIYKSDSKNINTAIKKVGTKDSTIKIKFYDDATISNISIDNDIHIYWERFFSILFTSMLLISIIKKRSFFLANLDKLFLMSIICIGISFILLTPKAVYVSYDDQIHFKNSLNIFQKDEYRLSYAEQLILDDSSVKDNKVYTTILEKKEVYKYLNKIHKESKDRFINSNDKGNLYTRFIYLPFTIGYRIADFINLSFTSCLFVAKLFNMLVYAFLMYLAIKLAKYGKKILFVFALFPSNLYLATHFSYDPGIIASLTLASVLFINIITSDKINKRYLIGFMLLVIWACLPKAIYCPLLLLPLFISNKKYDSKKQAIMFKLMLVFITFLLLLTFVFPAVSGSMAGDNRGGNTSVYEQLQFIMHRPINYVKTFALYTYYNLTDYLLGLYSFVDMRYILEDSIYFPLYFVLLLNWIYTILTSKTPNLNKNNKVIIFLESAAIWILIGTAFYLSFTPVGSGVILGVQNRYFLPILVLFSLLFIPKNNKVEKDSITNILIPILVLVVLLGILSINVIP